MTEKLFETALGVSAPWYVAGADFNPQARTLTIRVDFAPGSRFAVPGFDGEHPVHDTVGRHYRHLDFFQYECFLDVRVPRVRLANRRVVLRQIEPPWADKSPGFFLQKSGYLLVQLLILLGPPLWAALHYQINPNLTNVYEKFLIFLGGATGLVVALTAEILATLVPRSLAFIASILVYVSLAIAIYMRFYSPTWRRILLVTVVNGYLAAWSVFFGGIFQFLSMQ